MYEGNGQRFLDMFFGKLATPHWTSDPSVQGPACLGALYSATGKTDHANAHQVPVTGLATVLTAELLSFQETPPFSLERGTPP